jgi:hypothetical protein
MMLWIHMSEYIAKRAAECRQFMESEADPVRRAALRLLGDMWQALANVGATMNAETLNHEIAAIDRIHENYLRGGRMR